MFIYVVLIFFGSYRSNLKKHAEYILFFIEAIIQNILYLNKLIIYDIITLI
jgi:hypothetical protein